MARYQIIYWYDIPLQVKARDKNGTFSRPLSPRFQVAVDRAAMAAGLTDADSYVEGMNQSRPQRREGSAEAVVEALLAEIEAAHPQIDWRATVNLIKSQTADAADEIS
jgi:hypothetical protein